MMVFERDPNVLIEVEPPRVRPRGYEIERPPKPA
jgi:hypothetical protein